MKQWHYIAKYQNLLNICIVKRCKIKKNKSVNGFEQMGNHSMIRENINIGQKSITNTPSLEGWGYLLLFYLHSLTSVP